MKTTQQAFNELRKAHDELILEICKVLKIDKLLKKIDKLLK